MRLKFVFSEDFFPTDLYLAIFIRKISVWEIKKTLFTVVVLKVMLFIESLQELIAGFFCLLCNITVWAYFHVFLHAPSQPK